MHVRVTGGPDEGNAYHSEVLDFEMNAAARWNIVLPHSNGEKCVLYLGRRMSRNM